MSSPRDSTCPDEVIASVAAALNSESARGLGAIEEALKSYPRDPRLHFLYGSVLAGLGRIAEARVALSETLRLAPQFAIARFQLGFLELTSGAPAAAEAAWGPLEALPDDHHLRLFACGLRHLIRDEFPEAAAQLARGVDRNLENPDLNANIQLIMDRLRGDHLVPPAEDAISETHLLLRRYPRPPAQD